MPITFVIFLILMYLINIVEMYTTVFNAFDHSQFPNNLYTVPYNASKFHFDWVKISSLPTFALFFSPVFHHTECSCGRCGLLPGQVQELSLPQTLEWQVRVHRAGLLEPQESVVPHLEPRPERRRAGRHAGGLHQSVEDEAIIDSFIGEIKS